MAYRPDCPSPWPSEASRGAGSRREVSAETRLRERDYLGEGGGLHDYKLALPLRFRPLGGNLRNYPLLSRQELTQFAFTRSEARYLPMLGVC